GPGPGSARWPSPPDHSASCRPIAASNCFDSHAATGAGSGALPSGMSPSASSSGAGSTAWRLSTRGSPSIRAAWVRVMPVTANRSMPTRHTAELIQCHWCSVRSQKPRRCWRDRAGIEAAGGVMLRASRRRTDGAASTSEPDVDAQPHAARLVLVVVVVEVDDLVGPVLVHAVAVEVGELRVVGGEVAVEQVVDPGVDR